MGAEPDQREEPDAEHDSRGREQRAPPLARARAKEQERRHERRGRLDARRRGGHGRAERPPAAHERVDARHDHEHHERLVVRAAYHVHEHGRVQPDEQDRQQRVTPEALRRLPHERHDAERRRGSGHLEDPERRGHPQRRQRVGEQRERRPVHRLRVARSREAEDRVVRDRERRVRVRVEPVRHAKARVGDVGEDVLREKRRREQEQDMQPHDRPERDAERHVDRA